MLGNSLIFFTIILFLLTSCTSTPVASSNPCKLPILDGRGDVAIGGFPRIKERLRSVGQINTAMVLVDFPDAPANITPQEALKKIEKSSETFHEVSYGLFDYRITSSLKWYRMSKKSTEYAPLTKSFEHQKSYIVEALSLADKDVDFSNVDNFIVLANPDALGIGYAGPAFTPLKGDGITLDGKYLGNGATSAADLNH